MAELKPCPFCGGEARILNYEYDCEQPYYVDCPGCTYSADYETEEKAIAAWNRRAKPKPRALTVEQMSCMHGEPVYIVEFGKFNNKEWNLLDDDTPVDFDLQDVNFKNGDCYATYDYGKTWLAYNREPKGE